MMATGALWNLGPAPTPMPATPVSLQAAPTATSTPVTVPADLYRNAAEGFSLILPAGWEAWETGRRVPTVEIRHSEKDVYVAGQVLVYRLLEPVPVQKWLMDEVISYGAGSIEVAEEAPVQLGPDTSGYQALFHWQGVGIKEQWTGIIRGTQAFVFRFFGVPADFERLSGDRDALVSGFSLEAQDPYYVSRDEALLLSAGEIVTLDPALYRGSPAGVPGAIFSGLVTLDRDLNVEPDIAAGWTEYENGTVIMFRLRTDVVFHDGRPVTAHDFKYAWERATDPHTGSPTARTYLGDIVGVKEKLDGEATEVAGVQVVFDNLLKVTIDAPKPYFLHKLAYPVAYVVDRANVDSGDSWAEQPNGTGPYKLRLWDKDVLLLLERNQSYYGRIPGLFKVVYRLFAGPPMMMYEDEEIDIADVPVADLDRVRDPGNPLNSDLREGVKLCTRYLGFNVTVPPFDDPKVRQAFALALDVDKKVAVALKGSAERARGIVPPGMPGHNPSLAPVPFDPDRALSLLMESSYGGADNLPTIVSFANDEAFDWMWRTNLGIEVEGISLPELRDFHNRLYARELPLWVSRWCADYPDPQNFLEVLFHSDSDENHFGYFNPLVDALLERAAVEADPEARMLMYQEVEQLILDEWVAVPLWHSRDYVLVRPHIKGHELSPIGIPYLQDIYFERKEP